MLIYVLCAVFSSFLAYIYQKTRSLPTSETFNGLVPRVSIILSCVLLIILAGTRVDVGMDYRSYVEIFEGIGRGEAYSLEPGFIILNQIINYFTDNPQWLFFISSAITLVLIYRFTAKYSVNFAYSVFLYFGLCLIFFSFNTLRQFISIGIALLAFGPLLERRFLRYAFIMIAASMFHLTALIMLPLYFLLSVKITKLKIFVMSVVAVGMYVARDVILDLFFWLYPMHQESEFLLNRVEFSEIMITTSIILLLMIRYLRKANRLSYEGKDRIFINIVFFILFTHIAFAWVPGITRVLLFLDVLLLVIIPFMVNKFTRVRARDILIISIIYFSSYAFISTYIRDSHQVLPYKSTLMQSNVYEGVK